MFHETGRTRRALSQETLTRSRRPAVFAMVVLCAVILLAAAASGCASEPGSAPVVTVEDGPTTSADPTTTISADPTTSTSAATTTSDSSSTTAATARTFPRVFTDMALALAPLPVYGLADLPRGATMPDLWWPVVDLASAEEYTGPAKSNPRILNPNEDYGEGQLVLEMEAGIVVLLQNFRGDVGLTPGERVGQVGGHAAILYEINEGLLVQWGDDGRWYGVFARGLPADEVVALALQMELIPFEEKD